MARVRSGHFNCSRQGRLLHSRWIHTMTRCAAFALALALALLSSSVPAQVPRMFPPHALRGELVATAPPDVMLEGRAARLAPGARVRRLQYSPGR